MDERRRAGVQVGRVWDMQMTGKCCNNNCRQGRDCPHAVPVEPDVELAYIVVAVLMTAIAVVVGLVHGAARMGWV